MTPKQSRDKIRYATAPENRIAEVRANQRKREKARGVLIRVGAYFFEENPDCGLDRKKVVGALKVAIQALTPRNYHTPESRKAYKAKIAKARWQKVKERKEKGQCPKCGKKLPGHLKQCQGACRP